MGNFISKIFKSSILGSIGLIVLGTLLVFQSEATIISISYIIGGILVAIGALAILRFIRNSKEKVKRDLDIVYGIVTIILGIIVIRSPHAIASIIPFIIGFIIIINSATKLQYSFELKKNNNDLWKSTMILAFITTICGLILILNPFKGAEFITKIVGILILIYSILDIISTITIKNTVNKIHNAIEENIVDAQIIEEETPKSNKKKRNKKENK
ncbi:MAG: hypothetical protein HFJ11_02795 [Bacilli bacterium]|nr:hypothetical protein [Bacilli bacterium]